MKKFLCICSGTLILLGFIYFFNLSAYLIYKSNFSSYLKSLGILGSALLVIFVVAYSVIGGILFSGISKFLFASIIWKKADGSIWKFMKSF